jgi:hypothetical protein
MFLFQLGRVSCFLSFFWSSVGNKGKNCIMLWSDVATTIELWAWADCHACVSWWFGSGSGSWGGGQVDGDGEGGHSREFPSDSTFVVVVLLLLGGVYPLVLKRLRVRGSRIFFRIPGEDLGLEADC